MPTLSSAASGGSAAALKVPCRIIAATISCREALPCQPPTNEKTTPAANTPDHRKDAAATESMLVMNCQPTFISVAPAKSLFAIRSLRFHLIFSGSFAGSLRKIFISAVRQRSVVRCYDDQCRALHAGPFTMFNVAYCRLNVAVIQLRHHVTHIAPCSTLPSFAINNNAFTYHEISSLLPADTFAHTAQPHRR